MIKGDVLGDPISDEEMDRALEIEFPDSPTAPFNYSLYEGDIVLPNKDSLISVLHVSFKFLYLKIFRP